MTPELTARIVKVCEKIGWPRGLSIHNYHAGMGDNCLCEWHAKDIFDKIVYLHGQEISDILCGYFRRWLESRWEQVLIEYATNLPFTHRIECGMDGQLISTCLAANDYLDLLLTAVEKTLEQENAKCEK
jgi:hypothetical protein